MSEPITEPTERERAGERVTTTDQPTSAATGDTTSEVDTLATAAETDTPPVIAAPWKELLAAAARMRETSGRMTTDLDGLDAAVGPCLARWRGRTATEYKPRWEAALVQARAAASRLDRLGEFLDDYTADSVRTDAGLAEMIRRSESPAAPERK